MVQAVQKRSTEGRSLDDTRILLLLFRLFYERCVFVFDVISLYADVSVANFGQNLLDRVKFVFELPFREHHHRDFLMVIGELHALMDFQLMPDAEAPLDQLEFAFFFHIRGPFEASDFRRRLGAKNVLKNAAILEVFDFVWSIDPDLDLETLFRGTIRRLDDERLAGG